MELIILIIAVLAHFVIGILTLFYNPKSYTNRFFFSFTLFSSIWNIANYFSLHQVTPEGTLIAIRLVMFFAVLYSFSLFLTVHTFPSPKITLNKYSLFGMLALSIIVLILTQTPYIFSDVQGFGDNAQPIAGPAIPLFGLTTGFFILGSIYVLWRRYRKATGTLRTQLQYLIIGIMGSSILIFLTNFVLVIVFNISSFIIFGPTYTLIFAAATAYAIIAHRLFDIRVIIRRTVVFSGVLIFALVVYSMIVFAIPQLLGFGGQTFSPQSILSSTIAAAVIAVGLDPLRRWLTNVTDRFLFKGEYDPQEILHELAKSLGNVVDLDEALGIMMRIVVKNLRLPHAAAVVIRPHIQSSIEQPNPENPEFEVYRVKQVGYRNPSLLSIEEGDIMLKYFTQLRQLVVTEELEQAVVAFSGESTEKSVLDRLQRLKAAVAIPMIIKDRTIGVTFFGPKLSGDSFSNQDLDLLQIVAAETASAIEKARLYEEDQLKSEFVSIASHELLTPTAAIEGYLSMILDEKLVDVDEKAREYLVRVYTSARRLSQLVKDLLSVSRIEAGRIVVDRQPSSVDTVIDQVMNDLTPLAQERGITLQWKKPIKPLPQVFIDLEKLIQVLINLVSNAIKYNRAKGSITITSQQVSPRVVSVSVSDTGVGMTKEEINRLFEKFYRTKSATEAAIQGSGLGLYITKKLTELMDGTVSVTSQVGKGSTFTITLPVAADTNKRIITGDPKLMSPDQKTYIVSKK